MGLCKRAVYDILDSSLFTYVWIVDHSTSRLSIYDLVLKYNSRSGRERESVQSIEVRCICLGQSIIFIYSKLEEDKSDNILNDVLQVQSGSCNRAQPFVDLVEPALLWGRSYYRKKIQRSARKQPACPLMKHNLLSNPRHPLLAEVDPFSLHGTPIVLTQSPFSQILEWKSQSEGYI